MLWHDIIQFRAFCCMIVFLVCVPYCAVQFSTNTNSDFGNKISTYIRTLIEKYCELGSEKVSF